MPSTRDPASMTPDERAGELARLLATGLVRLGASLLAPTPPPTASAPPLRAPENSSEFPANRLAESPPKSVTGTGG